mgnify:CR=1 FL=1
MAVPFFAQRRKPRLRESFEHTGHFLKQQCQQSIAIRRHAGNLREIGDRLINTVAQGVRQAAIETESDHCRARPRDFALHFDQHARQFASAPDHIVGPFETGIFDARARSTPSSPKPNSAV